MKNLLKISLVGLLLYTIYYDLNIGTLPQPTTASVQKIENPREIKSEQQMTYKEAAVQSGDTVLTIIEKLNGELTVSINKVVQDFEQLNHGTKPEHIQPGKTYKFPIYP
ncbi:LysM peptidoglycan-binding domain-containing protein [Bacillus taeanensis]|uniref:LysM domain-containing protein n=1 Tax=Bacillus taeanensis TaxID=273032 RepID=A0A366XY90_9BACI|nr:LysM domain-containing protein [Bacillus taeanensis]RBW70538.1 hypothetical protein DS031_05795 [Bacillus taeanensis]